MSEFQKVINHDALGRLPLRITLTAAAPTYQMAPGDKCLIGISSAADAAGIITLPAKAEAAGGIYYINAPTGATGGDLSIAEKENATEITTYGDMDADDDWCIFFCDGINWKILKSGVA
jgi:hypothetical protein